MKVELTKSEIQSLVVSILQFASYYINEGGEGIKKDSLTMSWLNFVGKGEEIVEEELNKMSEQELWMSYRNIKNELKEMLK